MGKSVTAGHLVFELRDRPPLAAGHLDISFILRLKQGIVL